MTDEQFCKIYSAYNGEKMSHVDQLVQETFTGRELKEIIDFFTEQLKQRKKVIGIIGHIDHGKTTLSAAINIAMAQKPIEIETKTINAIIDEEKSIPYTLNFSKNVDYDVTISNRRERRRRERNKKTK